jgi:CheY-like chemotaxis protein
LEKPIVLLVDDNEATCTLMTALLQTEFAIETASDGLEAIEKLKSRNYAAILLDLLMPVANGFAVLDFLRAERPEVLPHVLIVTAALSSRHMQRVREYDVCGVIAKPFDVDSLFTAVKRCAGEDDLRPWRGPLLSGGMILLLADLLRRV